jgi:hypothetical protein
LEQLPVQNFAGLSLQAHEDARLIFGFTHSHFTAAALQRFFKPRELVFLKQVHSGRIIQVSGRQMLEDADGILLTTPGTVAVIQTADCIPLFFYADDFSTGGVIHVGWRGLCQGIEKNLLAILSGNAGRYTFYLGPAIEKNCYTVGEDLRLLFAAKSYAKDIFYPKGDGKYLLDLKAGLRLSLVESGISADRISDCGICTYCAKDRFPSFRRDGKTGKRIFNFLALK